MMATVPPISADTHTCLPSCVKLATRGRVSTRMLASTLKVLASMMCAMLVASDVAATILSSGLTDMPSGSTPTSISASTLPLCALQHGDVAVILVGDVDALALVVDVEQFRIRPGIHAPHHFERLAYR